MAEIGRLEKDKFNSEQKYKYLSDEQIKNAAQEQFTKHGILLLVTGMERLGITMPAEGRSMRVYDVKISYRLVDIDTGEYHQGEVVGSGADSTDKGVYKAITGAVKYIMHTTFLIRSGNDPEKDGKGEREAPKPKSEIPGHRTMMKNPDALITEAQVKRFFALKNRAGKTDAQAKEIIGRFGYTSTKDIKMKDYDAICTEAEKPTDEVCRSCGRPSEMIECGECPDCKMKNQ